MQHKVNCTIGEKRYLTVDEAAAWLGIGREKLDEMRRQGLRTVRLGIAKNAHIRIDKEDIIKYLESWKDR